MFIIYVRAKAMSDRENIIFINGLKQSKCDVYTVCHRTSTQEDWRKINSIPDSQKIIAKRILGAVGGIVVIKGDGNPLIMTPTTDTVFVIHE